MSALRARWRIPAPSALDPEQRTIVLISVLLGFESVLYSVITPVLPILPNPCGVRSTNAIRLSRANR